MGRKSNAKADDALMLSFIKGVNYFEDLNLSPLRPKPTKATHDQWTDCDGITYWVHRWKLSCRDGCAIHAPSYHSMREWPQLMRETYLIERLCSHGIGHPDPDSVAFLNRRGDDGWGAHGCDGCCSNPATGKHRKE